MKEEQMGRFAFPEIGSLLIECIHEGLPCSSDDEESTCNPGYPGSIPGFGRSPGERNGNPLQYSCLENSMDRGAWWATVRGVLKSQTRLRNYHYYYYTYMAIGC